MKNNFGNYVVQKALKVSSGFPKANLVTCIVKNIDKIGDRKLTAKWKSIVFPHLNNNNPINKSAINNTFNCGNVNNSFSQFQSGSSVLGNFNQMNNSFTGQPMMNTNSVIYNTMIPQMNNMRIYLNNCNNVTNQFPQNGMQNMLANTNRN